MKRVREWIRNPAMIVAVIGLIVALGGPAEAAKKLGINDFSKPAKKRIVGAGKVVYVTKSANVPPTGPQGYTDSVMCPPGLTAVGGGIKVGNDQFGFVNDSHPVTIGGGGGGIPATGWAGTGFNNAPIAGPAQITVICATATKVDGSAPLP
jgi:hypothetical protein